MSVVCLDFDGVICDSAGETGATGWRAAAQLWPDIEGDAPTAILEGFARIRPVLQTGFESILMVRLLFEGVGEDEILADFARLGPELMARHDLERAPLVTLFGETRDRWLRADLDSWLALHRFYPGAGETAARMAAAGTDVFIITTKQTRFAVALLEAAGVSLPADRVFGLEAGKKTEVIRALGQRQELAGNRFVFVEDRLETLLKVGQAEGLPELDLYLADWGYCTEAEIATARRDGRLTVLSLAAFNRLDADLANATG